jgi:hypothetical protein
MVEAGRVHAVIDESTGMVTFSEDPETHTSAATAAALDAAIHQTVELSDRVAALSEALLLEPAYLGKVAARERSGGGGGGGGGHFGGGGGGGGGLLGDEMGAFPQTG